MGLVFLHPYDDWDVITGQATLGLELLEDLPDMTTAVIPLGGGGLLGGTAMALKLQNPNIRVIGVQTEAVSPYLGYIQTGNYTPIQPNATTIADGIKVKLPGTANSAIIRQYVDDVVTVDDNQISEAIVALLERTRTIGEGAGATALAAMLHKKVPLGPNEKVAVVISGGNIDSTLVGRIIDFGLVSSGRYVRRDHRPRLAGPVGPFAGDRGRAWHERAPGRTPPGRATYPCWQDRDYFAN